MDVTLSRGVVVVEWGAYFYPHWLCCRWDNSKETSVSQERLFVDSWVQLVFAMMRFKEFLAALNFCLFLVARLKKGLRPYHGVRVPLVWNWGEGWDSKAISVDYVVGGAAKEPSGRRPILWKRQRSREFNDTKGYPGEDITSAVWATVDSFLCTDVFWGDFTVVFCRGFAVVFVVVSLRFLP